MTSLWIKNNMKQASPSQLDTLKREGEAFFREKGSTYHLMCTPHFTCLGLLGTIDYQRFS